MVWLMMMLYAVVCSQMQKYYYDASAAPKKKNKIHSNFQMLTTLSRECSRCDLSMILFLLFVGRKEEDMTYC